MTWRAFNFCRHRLSARPLFILSLGLFSSAILAQTRYPYIDFVMPLMVQRGTAARLEVQTTGSVKTAVQALIEGEGVRAEVLPHTAENKLPDNRAAVQLEIAPGAALGPREIRLATEEAITTPAEFYITDLPVAEESGKGNSLAAAQEIQIPGVVCGRIAGSVEVDWYKFSAKRGERVNFTVLGARLQETIHHIGRFIPHFDPFLALTDAEGRELAVNDDYYFADPLLSFEIPADGVYHLAVREANFKGHEFYTYGLVATAGPYAALTFPAALAPGSSSEVELIGPGCGPAVKGNLALPPDARPGERALARPVLAGGQEAAPVWAVASGLPAFLEKEALEPEANGQRESAQEIPLPAGLSGRIGRPDDVDVFTFAAAKGVRYRLEAFARRLYSPLDLELAILDSKGGAVMTQDDSRDLAGRSTKDPVAEWIAPEDGKYFIQLQDVHRRGGREFVYYLNCLAAEPDFELTSDPDLSMIGPGNRAPVYVRAHRRGGWNGPIDLAVEGLPAGVKAHSAPILEGMTDACIILEAAAEAPKGASLYRILGKASVQRSDGSAVELLRRAIPLAEVYQARRAPARNSAVAVTRPSDIRVQTEVIEVVLKPGESKPIPIQLSRAEFYKTGSVTLWGMWRFEGTIFGSSLPPGVAVDEGMSRTSLNGAEVEGVLALKAAADAKPISRVQTAVIGLVPIEFSVFVPHCTPPIYVTVTGKDGAVAKY
ncbi:MAG: PPC domain-containing protein [Planctomycetes bacterium]|nr:PPC domain-containing protein [Planctomycetota bacterium]